MALIKCTECGKEISDRAESCPGCGCPLTSKSDLELKSAISMAKFIEILASIKLQTNESLNHIKVGSDIPTGRAYTARLDCKVPESHDLLAILSGNDSHLICFTNQGLYYKSTASNFSCLYNELENYSVKSYKSSFIVVSNANNKIEMYVDKSSEAIVLLFNNISQLINSSVSSISLDIDKNIHDNYNKYDESHKLSIKQSHTFPFMTVVSILIVIIILILFYKITDERGPESFGGSIYAMKHEAKRSFSLLYYTLLPLLGLWVGLLIHKIIRRSYSLSDDGSSGPWSSRTLLAIAVGSVILPLIGFSFAVYGLSQKEKRTDGFILLIFSFFSIPGFGIFWGFVDYYFKAR
jgi:hypothetical protein